jgi:hypothetical protein
LESKWRETVAEVDRFRFAVAGSKLNSRAKRLPRLGVGLKAEDRSAGKSLLDQGHVGRTEVAIRCSHGVDGFEEMLQFGAHKALCGHEAAPHGIRRYFGELGDLGDRPAADVMHQQHRSVRLGKVVNRLANGQPG